ncbi:hypothetical protein M8C21_026284 [Ambrosia artemisiifolia]|uniref:DUF676 domain-containing protein n=1 Tax=Ambrosia artemisiifolia TaxID=4212 RepID=A0AAD5CZE2_AMBAR|nr:hypothetical protein M8C21_026284 [Ambrosia artemisiifolia]
MEENGVVNGSDDVVKKKKKKSGKAFGVKRLSCFRSSDYGYPTVEEVDVHGNVDMESDVSDKRQTHLVVMVNGLIGSAKNWRFAAKQFLKKYPQDLIVHCSKSNSALATLDGVDVMGTRLADEVISVIQRYPNLDKISFIGHSLGGLIARYAVAKLYTQDCANQLYQGNGNYRSEEKSITQVNLCSDHVSNGKIGGLEPINFITIASPHLGSRGHRQVPMFCGIRSLERLGYHTSGVLKRTGRHVYLKDKLNGQPPLLVQMANDTEDLKFISALKSFKRRVVYANVLSDHLVGWSTSSIRSRSELPKRKNLVRSGRYPHILKGGAVNTAKQEGSVDPQANNHKTRTATMEETMLRGLSQLCWERVDVSFKGSKQRYLAHNTIQVNTPWMNSDGADVIQHMVDNFLV